MLAPLPTATLIRIATLNIGLGFLWKLPDVLSRSICLSINIIALQEIGDPALTPNLSPHYSIISAPGPSKHEAGVALLIAHHFIPYCRSYFRSTTGRLVAAVLELEKGRRILIASVYMPSGLDHLSSHHQDIMTARQLYNELLSWTHDIQQVIIMGDHNETFTLDDRLPRPSVLHPAAVTASGPIYSLLNAGFTDTYRLLHPDAAASPGFTHIIPSKHRPTRSRIDYIWTHNIPHHALLDIHIDHTLEDLSHHLLLWITIDLGPCGFHNPLPASQLPHLYQMRLPNLRAVTESNQLRFIKHLDSCIHTHDSHLDSLAKQRTKQSLDTLASELADHVRRSAFATLPITGDAPLRSKNIINLSHQCHNLIHLRNITRELLRQHADTTPTASPEWLKSYHRCLQHGIYWRFRVDEDTSSWLNETQSLLRCIRTNIRHNKLCLIRTSTSSFDANPAARIHRMLDGDALPSQIFSVINDQGHLATSPEELSEVMVKHFEHVFAIPREIPTIHSYAMPPPDMLFSKSNIDTSWYTGLMEEPTEDELLDLLTDIPLISAPGLDEVSAGVWKIAIKQSVLVRHHVLALFSNCLLTGTFPSAWKTSIIVPLVKDAAKARAMNNIRPISLQSSLGKLLSKLLARRLGAMFQHHPILNPAQRGFVLGGTTTKCIDEVLDAWDWSRIKYKEFYTIFYDIMQAYDSVQKEPLERAMRRLHLPAPFIRFVIESLSELTSCIRTIYGITRRFVVQRSLRQGCPLAPLLFIILMDALHDGLENNPFTGKQHGCKLTHSIGIHSLSSIGYADDTEISTNTLSDLAAQNDWVQYFMRFNHLRLNPKKCELVGRGVDGHPVTAAALAIYNITIDGVALSPVDHNQPIRYLGVHSCFNGDWSEQQRKAIRMIMMYTRVAIKFKLSVKEAVYMFNTFLTPKLELAFHYVHGSGTNKWLEHCDSLLFASIRHLVKSPLKLSHSALSLLLDLHLPSCMEQVVKVSELFLRLNSSDSRWGGLSRTLMRQQLPSALTSDTPFPQPSRCSRLERASHLLVKKLLWSATINHESHQPGARIQHLFLQPSFTGGIPYDSSSSSTVHFTEGITRIAQDSWTGWSSPLDKLNSPIHVYTDGSYDSWSGTSSWSVVLGDEWLEDNFHLIPSEQLVQLSDTRGANLIGSNITCTTGVYPAELQAIARTLAMLPLNLHIIIHSDSKASIVAVCNYQDQLNERRRMRMSSRPILELIQHLRERRRKAGGSSNLLHIAAHTANSDIHSIGNRLADLRANSSRGNPRSTPTGLQQLPLDACEPHFFIKDQNESLLINDIRQSARTRTKELTLQRWLIKGNWSGFFACKGIIELGQSVLRTGSAFHQSALIHLATNSVHFYWSDTDGRESELLQLQCDDCSYVIASEVPLTIDHLAICPSASAIQTRATICRVVLQHLNSFPNCVTWLRAHGRSSLSEVMSSLFPLSVTATPEEVILYLPRCMIGGFTVGESTQASKMLRFHSLTDGHSALDQLRFKCLHFLFTHYQSLKPIRVA